MADFDSFSGGNVESPSNSSVEKKETGSTQVSESASNLGERLDKVSAISEQVSEKPKENAPKGGSGTKASQKKQDPADDGAASSFQYKIPDSEEVLKRVISVRIKKRVNGLLKEAKKLERSKTPNSAFKLAECLKEIRRLNGILKSLVNLTIDRLKELYGHFFPKVR